VLTDFVELPSQLMEHWFEEPEVLKEYARHYETGEPVPDELIDKMKKAKSFNQGFATIEYTACALLDMLLHQVEDYENFDITKFEKEELDRVGMPQGVVMRHRPGHFLHLFASTGYAAGYYGACQKGKGSFCPGRISGRGFACEIYVSLFIIIITNPIVFRLR
jgi:peptidyl-dipeptidase Dcp